MRTFPSAIGIAVAALTSGCIIVADEGPGASPPVITYAYAGCYADDYYRDFVWEFEADVSDDAGGSSIAEVFADVYDDRTGEWVDGFELYPEGGITWYSAWVGGSTWLDCQYPYYVVDITAVAIDQRQDTVSVYPDTW